MINKSFKDFMIVILALATIVFATYLRGGDIGAIAIAIEWVILAALIEGPFVIATQLVAKLAKTENIVFKAIFCTMLATVCLVVFYHTNKYGTALYMGFCAFAVPCIAFIHGYDRYFKKPRMVATA